MSTGNASRNFRSSEYERAANDWYVEPRWCVEQLADAIDFGDDLIWDPACGGGTIPDVFARRGHVTVATDICDRGYSAAVSGVDFLGFDPRVLTMPPGPWSIVMNPPFNQAERFARRALGLTAQRVAIVQQLSFLASKARHALFTEFPPSDLLIISKRPSMPPGHLIAEMGDKAFRSGTTDYCWIVWTRPHDRETRTRWLPPVLA